LVYIGNVGTGFSEMFLASLLRRLKGLETEKPNVRLPFKDVIWVKPRLVCEIKYAEFTPGGILRAPVFLRLRPDKNPKEVTFQEQDLKGP